jgi:hypothetical protein
LGRAHDVASLAEAVYREAVGRGRARRRHIRRALDGLTAGASPRLTNRWQALTALQQNLLRAVAAGERQLFAGRVRSDFGLRSSAAVARTITLLVDKGVLAKSENGLEFDDPLMRHWVSTHALRDVGIFPAKP